MVSCLWLGVTVEKSSLSLNPCTRFSTTVRYVSSEEKKGNQSTYRRCFFSVMSDLLILEAFSVFVENKGQI